MEVVKAEPIHEIGEYETGYRFKVELLEVEKVMIEVLNSQSGVKFRTYLNKTDNWWDENASKFQNDFSKVYPIVNSCILKERDSLQYEFEEKDDILSLKIIYVNDMFPFDVTIKIQRLISKNGLTDEKINILEYQLGMMRNMIATMNKPTMNKPTTNMNTIPDGDNIEIFNELNNLVFKGSFKNNKRNGPGTEYHPDTGAVVFKGTYKDGYRDGEGEHYGSNGELTQTVEYKKGIFHGKCIHYTVFAEDEIGERRVVRNLHYKDGKTHGDSVTYGYSSRAKDPQKRYFIQTTSQWKEGHQDGLCVQYIIDPKTREHRKNVEGNMSKGQYHGDYKSFSTDGSNVLSRYNMGICVS